MVGNIDNSNIKINNFGIIKDANIEISPLTVFIGPNSCGKSFTAKLIHSLGSNSDDDISQTVLKHAENSFKKLNEENKNQIIDLIDKIKRYIKTNPNLDSKPLTISIGEIDSLICDGIILYLSEIIGGMIKDQFEQELDDLINVDEDYFRIRIKDNILFKKANEKFVLDVKNISLKSGEEHLLDKNFLINISTDNDNFLFNIESIFGNNGGIDDFSIFFLFYRSIFSSIFGNVLLENSLYIPAERSEIVMDRKLLARKVQNKTDISKNQSEVLANILNIDPSKKSIFYEIACELEKEFSNVRVNISDSNIFHSIVYNYADDGEVDSGLLSTSINEISIFILYLKYVLKEGDLLIIEEPEAHLHPANQRILVKYFVKAINHGLKILITTHSDYIISQIDNMINLNNVDIKQLDELNYSLEDVLNKEDVGIYNFKKDGNLSYVAEKIIINEDGFIEDNFSKITDELYDETIKIRNFSKW